MAIWKFNDYQGMTHSTMRGDLYPNATLDNGYIVKVDAVNEDVRQLASTADTYGNVWIVGNLIDKAETENTADYEVTTSDFARVFKLDDIVGKRIEIDSTICSTAFASVAVGDYLIPTSGAYTFIERVAANVGTYQVALLVKKKTTLGNFTVDDASVGGYICEVVKITWENVEITAFDAIDDVAAGVVGDLTYADAAAVIAALPESATANTAVVTVPVTTWVDTDTYDGTTAGSYTFTATLGTIPAGYANTGSYTATVEVVVAAA